MGADVSRPASGDGEDDPFEQPWGGSASGRHSLSPGGGSLRVEDAVRSYAAAAREDRESPNPADAARAEVDRLTADLLAARVRLTETQERADAEKAALQSDFDDRQTRWELRASESWRRSSTNCPASSRSAMTPRPHRSPPRSRRNSTGSRAEAERARAEAEDAGAEADAAFVELAEAFAALSAAEARLAELEPPATKRRR